LRSVTNDRSRSSLVAVIVLGVLATVVLAWDVFLAGRIAQQRGVPREVAALSGLAALLIAPALVIAVATSSTLTSRSVSGVAWIWPATVAIFVLQSLYATIRRLVSPWIGVPIAAYDLLLMAVAATRYMGGGGGSPPAWALALAAAHTTALGALVGPWVLSSPYALLVPLVAPAFPPRWRMSRPVRLVLAAHAGAWVIATALWLPYATAAVHSSDRYTTGTMPARPGGDFSIGLRLLPALDAPPAPPDLRNDLALLDTTGAEIVSVVVNPGGAHRQTLDSLARVFDPLRRDSTILIVTLGYPDNAAATYRLDPPAYRAARVADAERIAHELHPDYLVLADEPYGRGARALGRLPVSAWVKYLTAAARAVHAVDPRIKTGIAAAAFDARDSALYQWAAAPGSPIDAVGFTLFPTFGGAESLDARMRIADRWMLRQPSPPKEQWVFAAGGNPAAHGEDAQAQAVWGEVTWAANHPAIKGVIVADAADYEMITGLRAASGRLRPATDMVIRATREAKTSD
jgi:hypothetical protein